MMIVDAQVHIWAASTPQRPWPARHKPHREVPLGKAELLREMDAAGVSRVVLVPPSWEGEYNDLVLAAAQAHPDRFAAMVRVNPEAAGVRGTLAGWRRQPGVLGLRFTFQSPLSQPLLTEGRMNWLWAEAETAGLPLMVSVPHAMVHLIDAVAGRHPRLKIVIDHLAIPSGSKGETAFRDLDKLLATAKRSNVAAKATCMPSYATDAYPFRSVHEPLRKVYDAFGPQRVFWGTDLTRLPCTYRQGITMFTEEIPWLTASDKEWIMGRGICEWLAACRTWYPTGC